MSETDMSYQRIFHTINNKQAIENAKLKIPAISTPFTLLIIIKKIKNKRVNSNT